MLSNYIFTTLCLICDGISLKHLPICQACLDELPKNLHPCQQCGVKIETKTLKICGKCQHTPPQYDTTIAPYYYEHAIKHLIIELKFYKKLHNVNLLGKLLAQHITKQQLPEYLIPIPIHRKRLSKRGFNQSMELCRVLSKELDIPILPNAILKKKITKAQASLTAKQRKQNLKNSFAINQDIKAQHIAIIDDVMTTGTTMNEMARLLKKAGIKQIEAWVCARTHKKFN